MNSSTSTPSNESSIVGTETLKQIRTPIAELVVESFQQLGYPQLGMLSCEQRDSAVILRGKLRSFYLAQVALTTAAKVPGVCRVINQLDVARR